MASLCQHHHNIKTDGGAFYIMDPHTGDIVWLFDNGRWEYDEPQGPLAPCLLYTSDAADDLLTV